LNENGWTALPVEHCTSRQHQLEPRMFLYIALEIRGYMTDTTCTLQRKIWLIIFLCLRVQIGDGVGAMQEGYTQYFFNSKAMYHTYMTHNLDDV